MISRAKIFTLIALSICSTNMYSQDTLKTQINQVTIYLQGALMERSVKTILQEGDNRIVLTGVSPTAVDENSIKLSGLGDARVNYLRYEQQQIYMSESDGKIKKLKSKVNTITDSLADLSALTSGLNRELTLIDRNQDLNGSQSSLSLEQVKEFSNYYRKRTQEINRKLAAIAITETKLKQQKTVLQNRYRKLENPQKDYRGFIFLDLQSDRKQAVELIINYNLKNAGWVPLYDIVAEDMTAQIKMDFSAKLYQTTGVTWENVPLKLSTGDPTSQNSMQELDPKYLREGMVKTYHPVGRNNERYNPLVGRVTGTVTSESGTPVPYATVAVRETGISTLTDENGNYSLTISGGRTLSFSDSSGVPVDRVISSGIINVKMPAVENRSNADYVQTLSGQVAGLNVRTGYSQPGTASEVVIRGKNSTNGNVQPLFVVNGEVVSEAEFRSLNPDNIKSISTLKDASASHIYGNRSRNGVVVVTTGPNVTKEEYITTQTYILPENYSIPPTGEPISVTIAEIALNADFQYYTAPVINENVYLVAELRDWEKHNLLPGEARVYFEGAYAGISYIDPDITTDKLTVSLGEDPNITVSRKEADDTKSRSFFRDRRIIDKTYILTVKNNRSRAVNIRLQDRIPQSRDSRITVDDVETGKADVDDNGVLTWDISLDPTEQAEREISYEVSFPKQLRINLD